MTEQAIINDAHARGMVVPTQSRDDGPKTVAQAYVAYPKKGMHDWIGAIDTQFYPCYLPKGPKLWLDNYAHQ